MQKKAHLSRAEERDGAWQGRKGEWGGPRAMGSSLALWGRLTAGEAEVKADSPKGGGAEVRAGSRGVRGRPEWNRT